MPRAVWPLYLGTFVNRFGAFVLVFLVLYVRSRGYGAAAAGGALSAYGIGGLVAAAAGGLLADRLGRRTVFAASMFGSAAAMLALWRASSLTAIVLLAAVAGALTELHRPAASALLTDLVAPEQRVVGFAVYRFAINVGAAAGPAVGGLIAQYGFGLLFVGDAATSVVCGTIALTRLPQGIRTARHEEQRGAGTRAILRDRTFLVFCASTLLGALVYVQAQATLPLAVVDAGHGKALYGALMSLNGLLVIAVELPLVTFTRRVAPRRPLVAGMLFVGAGFALTGVSGAAIALTLSVVVWTIGEMVWSPVASAYVAELAPPTLRARYNAAFGLTFALGTVVGPAAGAALYAWHADVLWLGCLAAGVLGAALVARIRDRPVELDPLPV